MKKLFMFLAVAGLATFGVSCSSSDDNTPPQGKTLSLKADANDILEGDTVTFTVTVDGKVESGAELYIDGGKISGLTHKFTEKGIYKVIAKKKGFEDSSEIQISVRAEGEPPVESKTLVLKAAPNTVAVGEIVNFTVQEGTEFIADAIIKLNGETVSNPWTATEVGTFKFKASKEGYEDSNEVSVTVTEPVVVPEPGDVEVNKIWHNGSLYDVNVSYYELATTMYNSSEGPVEGPAIYELNGEEGYWNLYFVNAVYFDGANIGDNFYTAVYVKNSTIVIEDNTIMDFGDRILPGLNNKFSNAAFVLNGEQIMATETSEGNLVVTELIVNDDDEGTTKFTFSMDDDAEGNNFRINFEGDTFIDKYNMSQATAPSIMKTNNESKRVLFGSKAIKLRVK